MNKKLIKWLLQIAATILLFYLALSKLNTNDLLQAFNSVNYLLFVIIPFFLIIDILINSHRLKSLYKFYGINTGISKIVTIKLQGMFFSMLFPFIGDFYKIQTFKNIYGASYAKNSLVVLLDRLIFTMALTIILCPIWMFNIIEVHWMLKISICILLLIELGFLFVINKPSIVERILSFLKKFIKHEAFLNINIEQRRGFGIEISTNTLVAIIRHILIAFLYLTIAYFVLPTFDVKIFIFIPTVFFIIISRVIPVSIGGMGLREYIAVIVFPQIGIQAEYAFTIAMLVSIIGIVQGLTGGFSYIYNRIYKLNELSSKETKN